MTAVSAQAHPLVAGMATCCAGASAWLLADPVQRRRTRLVLSGGGRGLPVGNQGWRTWAATVVRRSGVARLARRFGVEALCPPLGCLLALGCGSLVPLFVATVALPLVRRWRRAGALRSAHRARRDAVIELCTTAAAELRAGRQPREALIALPAAGLGAGWGAVIAEARFGGDVAPALRRAAQAPGAAGLTGMAACWQVAVDGGAGLAAGLDRVATTLRAEREQAEDLQAQLAGTRTTAVLLAALPGLGLLLGGAMGAPVGRVLLHTSAGAACLLVGIALEAAGLLWTARIVRAAASEHQEVRKPQEATHE